MRYRVKSCTFRRISHGVRAGIPLGGASPDRDAAPRAANGHSPSSCERRVSTAAATGRSDDALQVRHVRRTNESSVSRSMARTARIHFSTDSAGAAVRSSGSSSTHIVPMPWEGSRCSCVATATAMVGPGRRVEGGEPGDSDSRPHGRLTWRLPAGDGTTILLTRASSSDAPWPPYETWR